MSTRPELLTPAFRALSARLGQDPLQVQGPGGNTSIKDDTVMWIKASGTELADAVTKDIFVPVDRAAAVAEAHGEAGDGSCKTTVIDPKIELRPSIETTFHALLDHQVVAHTHSVATLVHAIGPEGREAVRGKLEGLPFALVPYAKPGLPLTQLIDAKATPEKTVFILQNHGLICCGESVDEVSNLIDEVETRLAMPVRKYPNVECSETAPPGYEWSDFGWLACDDRARAIATTGTYYPDHVVFLGPALATRSDTDEPPVLLLPDQGVALRNEAGSSQRAMLRCLSDVLARLPEEWNVEPIGPEAEAELLNWDAEKYRQALATRQ